MSDEIRRSPVDDAQRLDDIRWRAWSKGWLPPTSTVAFLLDHIDTLTADLSECRQLLQTETDRQCELVEELEIRRSPVEAGEIAKIAERLSSRWANPYEMLDHIDALTAKVERLEAAVGEQTEMARRWKNRAQSNLSKVKAARVKRDLIGEALDAVGADLHKAWAERDALRAALEAIDQFDTRNLSRSVRTIVRSALDNSPSPVEADEPSPIVPASSPGPESGTACDRYPREPGDDVGVTGTPSVTPTDPPRTAR